MKSPLKSKTEWINALAAIIAIVQAFQGQPWFNVELQLLILAVLNACLRFLTNTGLRGGK